MPDKLTFEGKDKNLTLSIGEDGSLSIEITARDDLVKIGQQNERLQVTIPDDASIDIDPSSAAMLAAWLIQTLPTAHRGEAS